MCISNLAGFVCNGVRISHSIDTQDDATYFTNCITGKKYVKVSSSAELFLIEDTVQYKGQFRSNYDAPGWHFRFADGEVLHTERSFPVNLLAMEVETFKELVKRSIVNVGGEL
jgi:hypothetical protein